MCGIAGILNLKLDKVPNLSRSLKVMNRLQQHRGPDGEGVWTHPQEMVGFAHRRLSIIDLTTGQQPMEDQAGNWVTYNGEIYNYLELREELGSNLFRTGSDTEVILHAYRKWGLECLDHLRGMFAFALWDQGQKILLCARDPFGIKPLYYTVTGGILYLASEPKALLPFLQDVETFTRADLLRNDADADQPDAWLAADVALPLTYRFEPGTVDDGVTVHVPVEVLARLGGDEFDWQVPALREELVTELIQSLPKDLRRNFVPAPDTARAVLTSLDPGAGSLLESLQRELQRRSGCSLPIDAFDLAKLPAHLRMTFVVEADRRHGSRARQGPRRRCSTDSRGRRRYAVAEAVGGDLARTGLRGWPDDLAELPRDVESAGGGRTVRGYPALVEAGTSGRRPACSRPRPSRPLRCPSVPAGCSGWRCLTGEGD